MKSKCSDIWSQPRVFVKTEKNKVCVPVCLRVASSRGDWEEVFFLNKKIFCLHQQMQKLLWSNIFWFTRTHTDMQAIIPVSNCTRTTICRFHALFLLFFVVFWQIILSCWELWSGRFSHQPLPKISRAKVTRFLNMAVFGSIRWPATVWNDICVCAHACLWEARCERVGWLVFIVSLKQNSF